MLPLSEFLSLLKQFVAIPSVSDSITDVTKTIEFTRNYFSDTPLTIRRFTHNRYPSLLISKTPVNKFSLILNAHIDVVPAKPELFTLQRKQDTIFGRGVLDMKTAGLVMMALFKALAASHTLPPNVALMIVCDEEIGGVNGTEYLLEKEHIETDFFLAGEPTNLAICTRLKGLLHILITQKGKASHGSKPWEGKNANVALVHKLSRFFQEYSLEKDLWQTTYTLSLLKGGSATNIVSDHAEAFLDIRRIDKETTEDILAKLRRYFPGTQLRLIRDHPAMATSENDPGVQRLKTITQKYIKTPPRVIRETYSSDAKYYSRKGIPCVNFGPIGGGMHADSEWLDLTSLEPYYKILKDFIVSYA